jgi:hypothetical protein
MRGRGAVPRATLLQALQALQAACDASQQPAPPSDAIQLPAAAAGEAVAAAAAGGGGGPAAARPTALAPDLAKPLRGDDADVLARPRPRVKPPKPHCTPLHVKLLVVGESGQGKTTFVHNLARAYGVADGDLPLLSAAGGSLAPRLAGSAQPPVSIMIVTDALCASSCWD